MGKSSNMDAVIGCAILGVLSLLTSLLVWVALSNLIISPIGLILGLSQLRKADLGRTTRRILWAALGLNGIGLLVGLAQIVSATLLT